MTQPDLVLTDPWEGLGPIWYWTTRDLDAITRRINGGTNGLADRRDRYTRAALVLLGYGPAEIRAFQWAQHIAADGIAGPTTRATLHAALTVRPIMNFKEL